MEAELSKIRPHTSSNLPHQKAPATLLSALEATFKEQNTDATPAAYFAGLLTALESTVQSERDGGLQLGDGDILPAELYLLALVGPFVPPPIVRHNLNTLLSLTAPLWPSLNAHAPPLRSQLTLYNAILRALDRALLENKAIRQSFSTILQLCVDSRPKVRRRAVDLVRDVLASPPSPLQRHPYSDHVGEWAVNSLSEVNALGSTKQKAKKNANTEDFSSAAIHLLTFVRPVLIYLPSSVLPTITTSLLSLPRFGNPFLSQNAYHVLSDLLSMPEDPTVTRNIEMSTSDLLKAVLTSPPLKTDVALLPSWLHVLGQIMPVLSKSDPSTCESEILKVWKSVFPFLDSSDANTRREAAGTLSALTNCLSPHLMEAAMSKNAPKSVIGQMLSQLSQSLDALAYARSLPELFSVISSFILSLRYRPDGRNTSTVAECVLLDLIVKIGEMRMKKGFEYKESLDGTLRTATAVLGPEILFKVLPLNLEPEDRAAGREARAFLLPLLVHNHPSPLSHFISYFVPLTERMFNLQQKADTEGRASEAKVWSVLVSQIWNGLPAYCYRTPDLQESLNPQFAQMLSQLLYNQPDLRPAVLKALRVIVTSNTQNPQRQDPPDDFVVPDDELSRNASFLRSQAESWLAVLFNVFSSVGRDVQGSVGEVISVWTSICDPQDVTKTCEKVVQMLKANISKNTVGRGKTDNEHTVISSLQDILVLLVPHMSEKDMQSIFSLCLTPELLRNRDNGVQKRAYKLLTKLVQSGKLSVDAEKLFAQMDEIADEVLPAAKKDRMSFLTALLEKLDRNSLHVIPSLVSEAVLGTKEPSEKARSAAFEFVVAMGHKMKEGGTVKRAKLNGMDEDDMTEVPASLHEYFTMMAGGLAGASPHMISATITAISRLVFEFKESLAAELLTDIFTALLEYLTSTNREIVKSALGFVKLSIHSLPVDLVQPHLSQLVPALLTWSRDHKNHFKEKVKHIFERMIRRFGWDNVFAHAGEDEDGKKVLLNIKKRKEKAKRKKAQRAEEGNEDEVEAKPKTTGDAFEDVLYGSESEVDDSDNDQADSRKPAKKGMESGARLRLDQDEPMDLLQGASSRIVARGSNKRRDPKKLAESFKTDEETGKMVIDSDDGTEVEQPDEVGAGTAYRDTITSADGFTRGSRGRIKFNKDTKKRRRENEEGGSDVEMTENNNTGLDSRKKLKSKPTKLGSEFKAKRAGGDVKKGGVDPYAYISLSQAAKGTKRKGQGSFTVTGKK